MKLYLDVCCLNRPFDDQTQDRIRLEAEAVLLVLTRLEAGDWEWVGSEVLDFEIERTPDLGRQARVKLLMTAVRHLIVVGPRDVTRAQQLEGLGFQPFDALHLACAERGDVDVFLSTDDRLVRRAARVADQLRVRVSNPLSWLAEVLEG
jgi:predicted nucleic acid-binding protein